MGPVEWSKVKQLFADALPLPPDIRRSYLANACVDNEALHREVESLLASHQHARSFLEGAPHLENQPVVARLLEGEYVGPYQLVSRIGAGGMGEVYRARDTRLDRTVAVKVLPPHVANDLVARDRFEREARTVAALNHPNICTLFDVGHEHGVYFLVMEYLDGETLAARLARGLLPPDKGLQYAIQVASALDGIHRAGVVHRDLKPSNIILTKSGAKLLDFGLAKAAATRQSNTTPALSSHDLTCSGAILGTLAYMSPEQTEGATSDARSDIFAFGAVLYEIVTGRKAFDADDPTNVIRRIREEEPAASDLPPRVERVIRTCLAKDPDDRWQTARDLLRELIWLTEPAVESPAHPPTRRFVVGSLAISGILAGVAVLLLASDALFTRTTERPLSARFEVTTPPTGDPMSFAVSPDGQQLAFVAIDQPVPKLWLRPLNHLVAQPLVGSDGASYPFWAPDGRSIAFFAEGKLKRLDLDRGVPRVIADAPFGRGGTWSRDGVILFAPTTASVLVRVPANGGVPVPVTQLTSGHNSHRWPQFLPDGRKFLFLSTHGSSGEPSIWMGTLDGRRVKQVIKEDTPGIFAAPDRLLFVRQATLYSMKFDASEGLVSGEPTPVLQPIGFDDNLSRSALSVSENGVLAHRALIAERRQLAWVDRRGRLLGYAAAPDDEALAAPELTPDGRRIAVFRTVRGNTDVWLIDQERRVPTRFTFDVKPDAYPVWAPSGDRIVFLSTQRGYNLVERSANGVGEEQPLFPTSQLRIPTDISSDGRFLLFNVQVQDTRVDIWALRMDRREAFPVVRTEFDEMSAQFSPDGAWLTYQSNASGRMEVYATPFRADGPRYQLSSNGGSQPRWAANGREIFYISADGQMMAVPVRVDRESATLEAGAARPLFATPLASGANVTPAVGTKPQYDVTSDGRFLINLPIHDDAARIIVLSLNWQSAIQP